MPIDSQTDGPQPLHPPGGEHTKPTFRASLPRPGIEFVERIQRQFLTILETELGEALQTPVSATLRKARQVTVN
jgi:hypothetical protein